MLTKYPKFKRGEVEEIYKKLSKSEQKVIENYLFYRKSRGMGSNSANDLRRYIIHIRHIMGCDFKKLDRLDKLTKLVVLINESYLSNEVKKNIRINLSNFFKYLFPDWSSRFMNLDCLINRKYKGEGSDGGKSDADLPVDKDIEDMLKSEHSTFWKTFLLFQSITGARTIEVRQTMTKNITFNEDGTATIEIFMTKTGNPKYVFTDKQTTDHIKKLIEEQKNTNQYGKYLFHSPIDKDKPIHKNSVNKWFKALSFKAIGRYLQPYDLRRKKATQLYNLSKNNIISENTALKLMGHSRSMMKTYDKTPIKKEIEILKKQAFNIEISPEKREELQKQIDELKQQIQDQKELVESMVVGYSRSPKEHHKIVQKWKEGKVDEVYADYDKQKKKMGL